MKSSNDSCSLWASATEDERLVAEILSDLKILWLKSESETLSQWIRTKRRSRLDGRRRPLVYRAPSPSSSVPMFQRTDKDIEEEMEEGGAASISPDTPLGYLTGNVGDEKSKRKKIPRKRSMKDYLDKIKELIWCKEVFEREIPKVKEYYNKLKAYNLELLARKEELLKQSQSQIQLDKVDIGKDLAQHTGSRRTHKFYPSNNKLTTVNAVKKMGPHKKELTIVKNVDPNEPSEEAQPSDIKGGPVDKRSTSAEARKVKEKINQERGL